MNLRNFLRLGLTAAAGAVLPACTTVNSLATATGRRAKRGLGIGTKAGSAWREKLELTRPGWFYSWASTPPENIPAGVEFVPMLWGKGSGDYAKLGEQLRKSGHRQLLGLNEPDQKDQSNVTVEEALALWPKLMETGLRLGSPGCVHPDREWMKNFMQGVSERKLRVDFVTIHSYGGLNADALMQRLESVHKMFNRPLWITEFAVGDWQAKTRAENKYRPEQIVEFMGKLLPRLDACDFVERYAWFPAKSDSAPLGSSALFNDDGTLTSVGQAYRSV